MGVRVRPTAFADASEDNLRRVITGAKMPEWQVDGLIEDYAHYRRGEAAQIADGVREATGGNPRTFESFAYDFANAFTPGKDGAQN